MSDDEKCIGNVDTADCGQSAVWRRSTQFSGDHHFCDEHAQREKDFGQCDPTGGQFLWYTRDPISTFWVPVPGERPSSSTPVHAPINHHTRAPHRPTYAVIVEGTYDPSVLGKITYELRLVRNGPGAVELRFTLNGMTYGAMPFDNLVKGATRIDPEHAVGPEKQIQQLRREVSEARAEKFDWQAKAEKLEERVLQLAETLRAYEDSTKA